jgi:hypothetical protein
VASSSYIHPSYIHKIISTYKSSSCCISVFNMQITKNNFLLHLFFFQLFIIRTYKNVFLHTKLFININQVLATFPYSICKLSRTIFCCIHFPFNCLLYRCIKLTECNVYLIHLNMWLIIICIALCFIATYK